MSLIVMADDGVAFNGASLDAGPLGGAETAFIGLAEGLAALGHRVQAFTTSDHALDRAGVAWRPVADGLPERADLYIANRGHRLLDLLPAAGRRCFWVHNPAGYVVKPRYLWRLLRHRPLIVFLGPFHESTLPRWVPTGGRMVIPYGIDERFRALPERTTPPARHAIFTSNPLRRLDWVLEIWAELIRPAVPDAELHVYSSLATYGGGDKAKNLAAAPILERARSLAASGVVLHPPVTKAVLATVLAETRVFLYGGDPGETFCLAAAESQAAGVPGVVARSTCLAERVRDGETGFVVDDDDRAGFARHAIDLLTGDALWRRQHHACVATQCGLAWTEAARRWAALLP
jgi:glycosyltransferase involved in cell wall biosynthesis